MRRRKVLTQLGGTATALAIGIPSIGSANPGNGNGGNKGKGNSSADVVVSDYGSIQEAVNAADSGDTVLVDGGTYVEEVRIEKDLTLRGQDDATVEAPTSPSEDGIVRAEGDIEVDVEQLTIDGDFNKEPAKDLWGIVYSGARGTIEDNTVKRVREDPLAGNQGGSGILVEDSDDIKIRDNEVLEYQKTGILARGDDTNAEVTSNTVTGQGATDTIAQNGIDLEIATGNVKDNEVSDHVYDAGGAVVSVGILLLPSDDINVKKNTLDNNEVGVGLIGDKNKIQNNDIKNGRANGPDENDWGVLLFGDNNKVVNNTITDYETGGGLNGKNNKFISNTLENVDTKVDDNGDKSKIQGNREQP